MFSNFLPTVKLGVSQGKVIRYSSHRHPVHYFLKVQQGWLRIPNTGRMPQNKCTGWYVRETQIFREFVHVDGEKEYK